MFIITFMQPLEWERVGSGLRPFFLVHSITPNILESRTLESRTPEGSTLHT
jgi:hypothetical protein